MLLWAQRGSLVPCQRACSHPCRCEWQLYDRPQSIPDSLWPRDRGHRSSAQAACRLNYRVVADLSYLLDTVTCSALSLPTPTSPTVTCRRLCLEHRRDFDDDEHFVWLGRRKQVVAGVFFRQLFHVLERSLFGDFRDLAAH